MANEITASRFSIDTDFTQDLEVPLPMGVDNEQGHVNFFTLLLIILSGRRKINGVVD